MGDEVSLLLGLIEKLGFPAWAVVVYFFGRSIVQQLGALQIEVRRLRKTIYRATRPSHYPTDDSPDDDEEEDEVYPGPAPHKPNGFFMRGRESE